MTDELVLDGAAEGLLDAGRVASGVLAVIAACPVGGTTAAPPPPPRLEDELEIDEAAMLELTCTISRS